MYSTINPTHSFPPAGTGRIVTQTLNEWKTARTLVSDTIRSYRDTCTRLHAVWTSSSCQSLERSLLEKALVTIDSELDSLATDAKNLLDTRSSLATMRNTSTILPRINTLPPEILVDILMSSGSSCSRNREYNLYDLMSVCTRWKEVVLNTTDLWHHIDVGRQTLGRITNFSLERAKGCSVHLHVYKIEPSEEKATRSKFSIHEMIKSLTPYMSQIRILELESDSQWPGSFVGTVLKLWPDITGSALRSLMVHLPNTRYTLYPTGFSSEDKIANTSSGDTKGMFPLTTLHLQNVKFDWSSGVYRNLTDLRLNLGHDDIEINASQIVDILSSSPELTILKLKSLAVNKVGDLESFAPITLGRLKVFYLDETYFPLDYMPLLSLVTLSGQNFTGTIHSTLQAFFARSKLATLYWRHSCRPWRHWLSISRLISRLQTLVLDGLDMGHADKKALSSRSPSAASSRIDCVILLNCAVNLEGLKTLLSMHKIRSLRLEKGTTTQGEGRDLHHVRRSLLEIYPELECSISDTDSTSNLPCRVMFDR
ncbi:hypothetical protein FRC12_021737 [Ceratobasidium sp. 428]|nr:hypothetical protein FRC12_021737 [Ceratobasidium sp. 428]